VPLKPGAFKTYSTPDDSFWCCVGTGMENHAKYGDTIYFHDDQSLYLNLFIASELNWTRKGLVVAQETRFPEEDTTRLTFKTARPVRLALKVRYPFWARAGMTLTVNGRKQAVPAKPGTYVTVDREWRTGDLVQVRVPMSLRLEAMPDNPRVVALLYGPIVLAGDLGREDLSSANRYGPSAPPLGRMRTPEIPVFIGNPDDVVAKVKPVSGAPLTFRTSGLAEPRDVTLIPFYKASDQRYTVYWNVYTGSEWKAKRAERTAEQARRRQIELGTVDTVNLSEPESEQAHQFKGEHTNQGDLEGRIWRDARNGWFSYELKVPPDGPAILVCTYRGSEGRQRRFDVLVDGEKIASESLPYHPTELLDVEYAVPEKLTRGKERVTVRFQSAADTATGAVFEVRTVQAPPAQK